MKNEEKTNSREKYPYVTNEKYLQIVPASYFVEVIDVNCKCISDIGSLEYEVQIEKRTVLLSDAGLNPNAMMIKSGNTYLTFIAVLHSQ